MSKWLTKNNVLWISGLFGSLLVLFLAALLFNFCGAYRHLCKDIYTLLAYVFLSFPLTFIFSLVTYRMRQEVFAYWIKFALWATPVLIILTFFIMGGGSSGLGVEGIIGGAFDAMLLIILYGLYCGISIWRIVHAYKMK